MTAHRGIMEVSAVKKPHALKESKPYRILCRKLDVLTKHSKAHPEKLNETRRKMLPLAIAAVTLYDSI